MRVFYAWQSDLPDETNRRAIRAALRRAKAKCELEFEELSIYLDEATREVPGSPNIPGTVLEKIAVADVFIADVSSVMRNSEGKATPNPNVVFELGYAVSHLGWNRVILVLNTHYGMVEELPFDFDRHRASPYQLTTALLVDGQKKLDELLLIALRAVIIADPKRPAEQRNLTPDAIRRQRDIENLKWILSTIHSPTIDEHISAGPKFIQDRIFHFWEGFSTVMRNSLFYLYDKNLEKELNKFHNAWNESLSHPEFYSNSGGNVHSLNQAILANVSNSREIMKNLNSAMKDMNTAWQNILQIIRNEYLEVDLDAANTRAAAEYVAFKAEMERKSGPK